MKFLPSLEEVKKNKNEDFNIVPLSVEIYSDFTTPIEVMKKLKTISKHCYLLESVEENKSYGRYTFLGYDPKMEITCINNRLEIKGEKNLSILTDSPDDYIREILKDYKSDKYSYLPSFTGGLVGYFSYDHIKYAEKSLNLDAKDEEHFKDIDLMLFDKVIAFDNFRQKIILIQNIKLDDIEKNYNEGIKSLEEMINIVKNVKADEPKKGRRTSDYRYLFDKNEYMDKVEVVKEHIREGDIFQLVLSNRIEADYEGSLFDTYRVLRTLNPSPYMFYFSSDDIEMAGASPETLVKVNDGKILTYPLAGTRKRGETKEEDDEFIKDLLSDEKELAEHNMLVDLGRNDLGRICEYGSVKVDRYMDILKYSHVIHIGSTVCGELRKDKDALDAIESVLPAGTLSGAPKIKACQIINKLEDNKRGVYGGAIGYLDFSGNMDTCIAIRLAFKKNGKVFIRSGAGIVADSVPENEFNECINKAKAVLTAIDTAMEEI
ncbi:anthranilate synthase component 1 [Lachnospiraceae bacterium RM5]|nr:anthranilate synthase component 1 [Lachnospiraceae bacterium RM5]